MTRTLSREDLQRRYRILDAEWHKLTRASLDAQAARDYDAAAALSRTQTRNALFTMQLSEERLNAADVDLLQEHIAENA